MLTQVDLYDLKVGDIFYEDDGYMSGPFIVREILPPNDQWQLGEVRAEDIITRTDINFAHNNFPGYCLNILKLIETR